MEHLTISAYRVNPVHKRLSIFIALLVGFVGLGLTPAVAVDERIIDIVSVNWPGSAPLPNTVEEIATAVDTDVNDRWKSYTTLVGDAKDRTISFKAGKVLTEPISLLTKMPCTEGNGVDFMSEMRTQAYKRLGISDDSKRYLIIAGPKAGCVWSGRARMGLPTSQSGTIILHDSGSAFVIAHELGHTFGLGHSNLLQCDSGVNDGPWGQDCKAIEYGGVIDVMGNIDTTSTLNTYHQWRMGLLDESQIKQVWQSETLTLAPSDFANGIKAIYLRDGKAAYWIEYRRAVPKLAYLEGLVVIRLDPPPISSIVSPNPLDASGPESGDRLGTDIWLLNMGNFRYAFGKATGTMTTTEGGLYSGNVMLSAKTSSTGAVVTITRKADTTPPPVPTLIDLSQWQYPSLEITKPGYDDGETAIAAFEISVDGVVSEVKSTPADNWYPTVLNPFSAPKSVRVRDLPEGSYNFALRALDVAGNTSGWTNAQKITIDRGYPIVTNSVDTVALVGDQVSLAWNGAKDEGTGLCQTNLVNSDGIVLQRSTAKTSPIIKITQGATINAKAQFFDCIGNGISGDLSITNTVTTAAKASRTGQWASAGSAYAAGSLKCNGKCTATLSLSGKVDFLAGAGASTITTGTKTLATIANSKLSKVRIGASVDLGETKKAIKISGSNFVLVGVQTNVATFSNSKQLDRVQVATDSSLSDAKQLALSKYGFNASDFSQEWTVLPMPKGTTTDDPSLDLCSTNYPSEKERLERRQVVASRVGSPFAFLSSEVVRYSSPAAAQGAYKELLAAVTQCKIDKGFKDPTGILIPYSFAEIKNIPAGLMPDSSRVLVRATIDSGDNTRQLLGFYQFNSAIFTGLYVMTNSQTPYTDEQVSTWLQVAATMASRLKG